MAVYEDRERFIPYRRAEVLELVCTDGKLVPADQEKFRAFYKILESLFHFEFHEQVENLKNDYFPFNPDRDTKTIREYSKAELAEREQRLFEKFKEVLNGANYEEITQQELEHALAAESLFKISLFVDFDDFDRQLLASRGDVIHKATVRKGFKKVEIDVPTYERVALVFKFKGEDYFAGKNRKGLAFQPGSMVIKLFKNIPKADLEMIFPNTQIRMKLKDKLLLGVPAIAGGIGIALKAGAGLVAAVLVLWFMIRGIFTDGGLHQPGPKDIAAMIGGLAALAAIGGFIFRQWTKFKNLKIVFMKTLADSLYFKNLDNNAGVFHHVIDAAEEEECKEAILAYYFLLQSPGGLAESDLDDVIEGWFEKKHGTRIDFEVDDALGKLKRLELCTETPGADGKPIYRVPDLDKACERLDSIWDNYFQYNV